MQSTRHTLINRARSTSPFATMLNMPEVEIVATDVFDDCQADDAVTSRVVPSDNRPVATSCHRHVSDR